MEQHVNLEAYILAVLSPQDRLEAALRIAREAFQDTTLTLADIEVAVRKVRRKHYAGAQKKLRAVVDTGEEIKL